MSLSVSKPTRNADLRHAQSIGRQRKHTSAEARSAEAIASVIRKCLADGQALHDLDTYNLNEEIWTELLEVLTRGVGPCSRRW